MSDVFDSRGQSNQFPNRWATLPSIPPGQSPTPSAENALIPYGKPFPGGGGGEDRISQLENRVNVAERSNRALLEEVVRLQSELKNQTRRSEETLQEEAASRKQMENSLRSSNDLITQLSTRLQRAEERIHDEHGALSALVNHTKSMEQAVIGGQKEMMSRRDLQGNKLSEVQNEIEEVNRAKAQLERVTFQLVDDLRQLKARVDTQAMDFTSVATELKNKSRRLEEENRQTLDNLRKQGESHTASEQNSGQLRVQVEARLSELRDVIVELRSKQDQETQERRLLEQAITLKVGDVHSLVSEQNRKREEAMHAIESLQRERDHSAETDKIKLQAKLAETQDEVSKKLMGKEIKLREELQARYSQLEQAIRGEQETRQKFEKDLREQAEQRWDAIQKLHDEEQGTSREQLRTEKKKTNEALQKLNEAVNLLEKELEAQTSKQEKVMAAEINSRKTHEKNIDDALENLHDKVNVATATMQQAIGGVTLQLSAQQDKLKQEMRNILEEGSGSQGRSMADMDARLVALSTKVSQSEDMLEAKIQAASAVQAQNIREKIESIGLWQEVTQQTMREIQAQNQRAVEDLYQLKEKHHLLKSEAESRVAAEAESRNREIDHLRKELEYMTNRSIGKAEGAAEGVSAAVGAGPSARQEDIEAIQQSIRKLAESIQTVKTVLGLKIQSEGKLRFEEVKSLQDDVIRLRALIEPLVRVKPMPRIFIKPSNVDRMAKFEAEKEAPAINKWNMYTAYRWLLWKQRWLYVIWKKKSGLDLSGALTDRPDNEPENNDPRNESPSKSPAKSPSKSPTKNTSDNNDQNSERDDEKSEKDNDEGKKDNKDEPGLGADW